jgi:Tfp pilus assembly protein PilP
MQIFLYFAVGLLAIGFGIGVATQFTAAVHSQEGLSAPVPVVPLSGLGAVKVDNVTKESQGSAGLNQRQSSSGVNQGQTPGDVTEAKPVSPTGGTELIEQSNIYQDLGSENQGMGGGNTPPDLVTDGVSAESATNPQDTRSYGGEAFSSDTSPQVLGVSNNDEKSREGPGVLVQSAPEDEGEKPRDNSVGTAESGMKTSRLEGFMDPFDYDPAGKKDPFRPLEADRPAEAGSFEGPFQPLQRFEVDQLELVGIIWNVKAPKAMINDPLGNTHVIVENTRMGRNSGYVAAIREGEVVIVEPFVEDGRMTYSTRLLRIK